MELPPTLQLLGRRLLTVRKKCFFAGFEREFHVGDQVRRDSSPRRTSRSSGTREKLEIHDVISEIVNLTGE